MRFEIMLLIYAIIFVFAIILFSYYFLNSTDYIKNNIYLLTKSLSCISIVLGVLYTFVRYYEYQTQIISQNKDKLNKSFINLSNTFMLYREELKFLYYDINKGMGYPEPSGIRNKVNITYEYHMSIQIINYLSNLFFTYKLMDPLNYNNPENAYSIQYIKNYISSDIFYEHWKQLNNTYDPIFVTFIEELKNTITKSV